MASTTRPCVAVVLALVLSAVAAGQFDCSTATLAVNGMNLGSVDAWGDNAWFRYVPTCTGTVTATFCPPGWASFDSVLTVYEGFAGCCALTWIAYNNDFCGTEALVTFPARAGRDYYLHVQRSGSVNDQFGLWISCSAGPFVPLNDHCANALPLGASCPTAGTNVGGSVGPEPFITCSAAGVGSDVWFTFPAMYGGTYEVTTCYPATNFDTVVQVWVGTCAVLNVDACNDDACSYLGGHGLNSTITINALAGYTYYVSVGGYGNAQGEFVVCVRPVGKVNFGLSNYFAGSLAYGIVGGPPTGPALAAITLNQGAFPNGWFLGIDIGLSELATEITTYPFRTTLGSCGEVFIGPYSGLPPGLTVYGVAIVTLPGQDSIHMTSDPSWATVW